MAGSSVILRNKTRQIATTQDDNQRRLQRNINAQAHAARLEADRKDLEAARSRMLALESRLCLVDAKAMDGLIDRMVALVERCQRECDCPALEADPLRMER